MSSRTLHEYQKHVVHTAIDRIFSGEPGSGLFLEPGLGKTICSLKIIEISKILSKCDNGVLVIAPLRVAQTVWQREIKEWGLDLKAVFVHGSKKQRDAALSKKADIYIISSDGVCWLDKEYPNLWFDMVFIDESTKFKSWSAKRTKHLRHIVKRTFHRFILTGTPAPNSLGDIFPQHYMIDLGKCLGESVMKFRSQYMQQTGWEGRKWEVRKDMIEPLKNRIAPQCLYLAARDHIKMPELVVNDIMVELPEKARKVYDDMEKELFAAIEMMDETKPLMATTAGAKYNLCRQIANGGAYSTDELFGTRDTLYIHSAKVDALEDLYEDLNGKQLLVAYMFDHDLQRIREVFPKIRAINGSTPRKELDSIIDTWIAGNEGILACQCQAMSHGLDGFQKGGSDIAWFGLSDQPEVVTQLIARMYRQGAVSNQTRVHRILATKTIDQAIVKRIEDKDTSQRALLNAIKEYQNGKDKTAGIRKVTPIQCNDFDNVG